MNIYFAILFSLFLIDIGFVMAKHGYLKEGRYNAPASIFAYAIVTGLILLGIYVG